MAKATKVRGVEVFMTDNEAAALSRLLNYGMDYSTRTALGLDDLAEEITTAAGWRSFDFAQKASATADDA